MRAQPFWISRAGGVGEIRPCLLILGASRPLVESGAAETEVVLPQTRNFPIQTCGADKRLAIATEGKGRKRSGFIPFGYVFVTQRQIKTEYVSVAQDQRHPKDTAYVTAPHVRTSLERVPVIQSRTGVHIHIFV